MEASHKDAGPCPKQRRHMSARMSTSCKSYYQAVDPDNRDQDSRLCHLEVVPESMSECANRCTLLLRRVRTARSFGRRKRMARKLGEAASGTGNRYFLLIASRNPSLEEGLRQDQLLLANRKRVGIDVLEYRRAGGRSATFPTHTRMSIAHTGEFGSQDPKMRQII